MTKIRQWTVSFSAKLEDGTELSKLFRSAALDPPTINDAIEYLERIKRNMVMIEDE